MDSENEETPLTNIEEFKTSAITGMKTGAALATSIVLATFTGKLATTFAKAASEDNFAQWTPGALGAITAATIAAFCLLTSHKVGAFSGEANRFKTYGTTLLLAGLLTVNGLGSLSNYATKSITQASSDFLADTELEHHRALNEIKINTELNATVADKKFEKVEGQHKFTIR